MFIKKVKKIEQQVDKNFDKYILLCFHAVRRSLLFFILIIWGRREGIEYLRQEECLGNITEFFFLKMLGPE